MAIDRLQEFALAFPHRGEDKVLASLYASDIVHLTSYTPAETSHREASDNVSLDANRTAREKTLGRIAEQLDLAHATLAFVAEVDPLTKGLVQSFFPDEIYVNSADLSKAAAMVSSHGYTDLMRGGLALRQQLAEQRGRQEVLVHDQAKLLPWASLPVDMTRSGQWRRIALLYGVLSSPDKTRALNRLSEEHLVVSIDSVFEEKGGSRVVIACLRAQLDDVRALVTSEGLLEQDLSGVKGTIQSALDEIADTQRSVKEKLGDLQLEAAALVMRKQELVVYREYLLNERVRLEASQTFTRTERCSVATGYVREVDAGSLRELSAGLEGAVCVTGEPSEGDGTPVSITNNKWLKPLEILIHMYSFPVYSTFDPTMLLAIPFLLFYALCLGDVLYGALQIGICLYFIRKYKFSAGVRDFMMVFLYGGAAAMVVGALTGGWGGDLLSVTYLGKGNPVAHFVSSLTVINPLQAAFQFLVIVWIIGGINQLYGVCLAIYKAARRHDYASIIYDCVGWLLFLPAISALLFIGAKWGSVFRTGYQAALGIGLVLLLLGGARQGKGGAKIVTAVVNLYGIQSSYGVGSFLGDVLSYSRLLALGLTTSILGSAFNMIASLAKFPTAGVAVNLIVRVVFGGVILLFGHLLNYFMGTMGAFVHAARLMLLEFFGRFYEGGAPRFRRFGFSSEIVKVIDKPAIS
jgi:V/A-type H+-transporting ATPase subunit I